MGRKSKLDKLLDSIDLTLEPIKKEVRVTAPKLTRKPRRSILDIRRKK